MVAQYYTYAGIYEKTYIITLRVVMFYTYEGKVIINHLFLQILGNTGAADEDMVET